MSNNGSCGRPWTPYEDVLLRAAVAIYGDNTEKWKAIALSVPGRTNKACRKRWLHSLSPNVKKSAWTPEEDRLLLSLFERYPNKWSRIARDIPGRTDDACSKRYREALDPNLKKDDWTDTEDRRLSDALMRHGGPSKPKWGLIGQELCRSGLGCRNRWRLLERKRKSASRQGNDTRTQTSLSDAPQQPSVDTWPAIPESESSYWIAVFDTLGINLDTLIASGGGDLSVVSVDEQLEDQLQPSVDAVCGLDELIIDGQNRPVSTSIESEQSLGSTSLEAGPCFSSSSSSEGGPESQAANHVSQTEERAQHITPSPSNNESSNRSSTLPAQNVFAAQDDDFDLYDNDPQHSSRNDDDCANIAPDGPSPSVGVPNVSQRTNESGTDFQENLSSLGALAHAASTLSPSPCAAPAPSILEQTQQTQEFAVPPRKRRRAAVDSPASAGIRILSDIIVRPEAEPKLSSSLPVAGDSSILAYVCGHSICFPAGASRSTACYATSGELLSHYKEKHMYNAGASEETPFRCGLKGCNKSWKSINGLQYHLQVSMVHYRHICSRATSRKEVAGDHDLGTATDTPGTGLSNESSRISSRRLHKCPYPACLKEYKQLSGLRYHLLHGHPKEMPVQLTSIPPRIAKQLGVETATELSVGTATSATETLEEKREDRWVAKTKRMSEVRGFEKSQRHKHSRPLFEDPQDIASSTEA